MTFENDKTLDDLEQIRKRAEANLTDLGELLKSDSEYAGDIEALRRHSTCFIEGVEEIAEKMRSELE